MEEEPNFREFESTSLYKKAMGISELVSRLTESIEKSDIDFEIGTHRDMLEHNLSFMRQNALIIPAKIAGAHGAGLYDLKMENAAIIRKAARELITDTRGIQIHGFKDILNIWICCGKK